MGNANPRYLSAWPKEQLTGGGGGAAVVYGTSAELVAGLDTVKLFHAAAMAGASVKAFGSILDDGKYVQVTSTGKIDLSLLPLTSALVYRGVEQPTSAAPATAAVGDVYLLDAAGTFGASWGVLSGQIGAVGDQLIYDGVKWNLVGATSAGGTVTTVGAGNGLLGGPITTAGTLSVNYGTVSDLIAGTDTVKLFNAATLAGASAITFAGAADAGKLVKLDATGKIDPTLLPPAGGTGTVTSIATGPGINGGPITTTGTISLANSGVVAGTYKSVVVDTYGRVTAGSNPSTLAGYGISDAVPSSATVSGAMSLTGGGALSGAPLNLTLVNDTVSPGAAKYYGTDGAGVRGWQTFPAAGGTGTVTSVAAGTGLAGGTITTTGTISLAASGASAGTYGSATLIPVVTVDVYGRITSVTTQTATPAWASVTGKPTTVAGYGITDAVVNTRQITGATSLTGGGDLTADRTISLVNDAAAPGNSFYYGTSNTGVKGWHALPAGGGSGTVTSVTAGTGLTGGTISTTGTIALAASGVTAGSYRSVTVDTYGRVTGGTNPTTLAGYGITDAVATTRQITGATSLTGGGDLTADRTISLVNDAAAPGNNFFYGTTSAGVKGWRDLSGLGFVVGPATATDNAIARYDATTGKLIQNSGVVIDDTNNVSGVNTIAVTANANHAVLATTGAMDLALAQMFTATAGAAISWSFANVPAARGVTVVLHLTNGGQFTQTWPGTVKWPGGTAPTLTAAGTDVLVFVTHDGGTTWRGNIFGKDIK